MRFVLAALLVVVLDGRVAAQEVTVEGGAARLGVSVSLGDVSVSQAFDGGYLAASVRVLDWLAAYGGVNTLADVGASGQAGASAWLAPRSWIARPVVRGGALFDGEGAVLSGGVGVYVGRRAGALFTTDWAAHDGEAYTVLHVGGYYTFGID